MEDVDYRAITGIHIGEMFDLFHSIPIDTGKETSMLKDNWSHNNVKSCTQIFTFTDYMEFLTGYQTESQFNIDVSMTYINTQDH